MCSGLTASKIGNELRKFLQYAFPIMRFLILGNRLFTACHTLLRRGSFTSTAGPGSIRLFSSGGRAAGEYLRFIPVPLPMPLLKLISVFVKSVTLSVSRHKQARGYHILRDPCFQFHVDVKSSDGIRHAWSNQPLCHPLGFNPDCSLV